MKRSLAIFLAFAAVALAVVLATRTTSPAFTGKRIPPPPEQDAPWSPPETRLPEGLVSAVKVLFDQGLADPRGCEYRQIELQTGNCWSGDAGIRRTHGWVLPPKPGSECSTNERYAVAWNGLVYPTVSIGAKADVRSDVATLLAKDRAFLDKELAGREEREAAKRMAALAEGRSYSPSGFFFGLRRHRAWSEPVSVSHETMLPVKAALLVRLGRAELAEKVWCQWSVDEEEEEEEEKVDPYFMLASDWTWALYDRAVCAHMRGDDELAFVSVWMLYHIRRRVEPEVKRRAQGLELHDDGLSLQGRSHPSLQFLASLPMLLADQERRAREPKRERVFEAGLDRFPSKRERISALVRDLEEVDVRQCSQPGGVILGEDPIVQTLIREGDEAVEPLLECLAEDTRLTRSVNFGRDFSYRRTILGVHEAAYCALAGIMHVDFFEAEHGSDSLTLRGREGRKAVAAKIRAYWLKNRGIPLEERWYRALADDAASPEQWLHAVSNITQPTNVMNFPGSMWPSSLQEEQLGPGEKPKLRGESLRSETDPSVSELIAERMRDLASRRGDKKHYRIQEAKQLAMSLAEWDGPDAVDELRWFTKHAEPSVDMFEKRVELGDGRALDEYVEWLRKTGWAVGGAFRLAWQKFDDPAVARVTDWLFAGEDS
ncbi:MAG: hypothetical protein ACYSU0_19560, partial [Planctomycetota bacterium]